MISVKNIFKKYGKFHDAELSMVKWSFLERRIELIISDINSAFCGLPEYVGEQPGAIVFSEVSKIDIEFDPFEEGLTIYGCNIEDDNEEGGGALSIVFWPHGRISVRFSLLEIITNQFS